MNISEPRYLQVQKILEQENGAYRLLNACRASCIRLGSDDRRKMFEKSCLPTSSPSPLCLLSPHSNSDHPQEASCPAKAAWCLYAPYREGAGSHIASLSLWPGKVVRPLGLGWQERLSSTRLAQRKQESRQTRKQVQDRELQVLSMFLAYSESGIPSRESVLK